MFSDRTGYSEDVFEKFNATGTLNTPYSLIGYVKNEDSGNFFSFVDFSSSLAPLSFEKTRDSPYVYHKPKNLDWKIGGACNVGEAIVFKECSDPNDKSSCERNLYDEVWQVHSTGDYPNVNDYYTGDMEFYFAYSCYDPKMSFADTFERKYLYNGQCVGYQDSDGRGEEYSTEKYCLDALEDQREEQQEQEKARQEELRLDNLEEQCEDNGGDFNRNRERCTYPEPEEDDSSNDNTNDDSTNTDDTNTDSGTDEGNLDSGDTSTDDTSTDSGDSTTDDSTNTGGSSDGDSLTCSAYEDQKEGECKFSVSKLFSDNGIKDYWEDKPLNIVGAVFLVLVIIFLVIPTVRMKTKKGGKK